MLLGGIVFITYARPGGLHLLPEASMVMFAFGLGILCQINLPRFGAWRMSAVYLATALLSWLSWQHIERPCIKAGQNIMKRRRQTGKVQAGI